MNLPNSMRFIAVAEPGGPEAMQLTSGPLPTPQRGEVLIRVLAAGVNRPDVMQRKGLYPPPRDANPVLGLEVAGEIVGGDETTGWNIGDRVCALINGGGYAEYCVAPATQCLRWPHRYDAIHAAVLPENYFTVWANLFQMGCLSAGETALVHGGSSGIGVTAIQLGVEFGARVFTTAGSKKKCDACIGLGAELAINYREADFVAAIQQHTQKRGVDVILDMVAGDYTPRNLSCLALDGRLVLIAFQRGAIVEQFDLTRIMTQRLTVTGSTMRPRTAKQKGEIAEQLRNRVWPILDEGRCAPVIDQIFKLADAAQAHAAMEGGEHIGKILLQVDDWLR